MANILITWELGGGMGHLARLRPIAIGLHDRGHRVFCAFRELGNVKTVFGDAQVEFLQAPSIRGRAGRDGRAPETYAQMLVRSAFGNECELPVLVRAWQTLFDLARPDLLVCDHSPTALVAARGYAFKRALVGTGFICPPLGPPLPSFRPGLSLEQRLSDEQTVLYRVNRLLNDRGAPLLDYLGQLYTDVDELALTTFRELDHFGPREDAQYWGTWPVGVGESTEVNWPEGERPRVYGYLKPFKALEALLAHLSSLRVPTVIAVDGIEEGLQERYASETLGFLRQPVDIARAAEWCDIALLNGTHGMLTGMLLAGKPTMNVPTQLEQRLAAMKVVEMRAGVVASAGEPEQAVKALDFVLANRDRLAEGAARFAARYRDFDPTVQVHTLVDRLVALVPRF